MQASLERAASLLAAQGISIALAELVEHEADLLQIELPHGEPRVIRDVVSRCFATCDVLVAADEIVVPHLFVSDMDSTIIGQECIDELADYAGIKPQIAAITERAMQGELDFAAALRERVALLEGLNESTVTACLAERIRPNAGARVLVQTLKARGCRTVLVTGGFHHFADPVAEELGFDRVVANHLGVSGGSLNGKVLGRVCDAGAKADVLREERGLLGANAVALSLGDGANDVPMLHAADYGVAFHGKAAARDCANGSIDRGDLLSVLRLLGLT